MLVALVIFYFSGHLLSVQGCTFGELRLVGGHSSTEGRVEICINNVWGTICDDYWDVDDAKVVCRQLGYSTKGAKSYRRAYFGQGTGRIFLDDVGCLGSESSLLQCYHRSIGYHDCTHREDASVSCLTQDLSPGAIAGIIISGLVVIICIAVCIIICAIIIIKKRTKIQSQRQRQGIADTAHLRAVPPASTLSNTYPPPPPYLASVPAPPNNMPPPQMTTNQPMAAVSTTGAQGAVPVVFHPGNQAVSYNVPSAQPMYYYYPYVPQYIPLTEPTMTQSVVPQSVPQQSQTIAPTDHELPQVQSIANEDEAPIVPPSNSTEEEPKESEGDDEADDAPLLTA